MVEVLTPLVAEQIDWVNIMPEYETPECPPPAEAHSEADEYENWREELLRECKKETYENDISAGWKRAAFVSKSKGTSNGKGRKPFPKPRKRKFLVEVELICPPCEKVEWTNVVEDNMGKLDPYTKDGVPVERVVERLRKRSLDEKVYGKLTR